MWRRKPKRPPHKGVIVKKDSAPKAGTRLTSERISADLRSLNESWSRKASEGGA